MTSGVTDRALAALLGLCSFGLLHVQSAEIDGFEQQRREAAITHSVGQYAAGKGEEQARRFGKEERLNLISGHVAHSKKTGRSEEQTSELQSLMRISYAGFGL